MKRKGQMFIVTMVFLTGLIFAVQQIIYQYSFIDPSDPMQRNDAPLFFAIRDAYNTSINSASSCAIANASVQQLHYWLMGSSMGPYNLELRYNGLSSPDLDCGRWGSGDVLALEVRITGPITDSTAIYRYS
jgi:hypothetical protein